MPSEKSHRVSVRKNVRNRAERSAVRTVRSNAMAVAAEGGANAAKTVKSAIAAVDRAGRKHTIHTNKASRQKSQLMRAMNKKV